MTRDRNRKTKWVGALLVGLLLIMAAVALARWGSAGRTITYRTGIEGASGADSDSVVPQGADGDSCAPSG